MRDSGLITLASTRSSCSEFTVRVSLLILFAFILGTARADELTRTVQEQLQAQGSYSGPLDGKPSPEFTKALKAFQQRHNLPATGSVDRATAKALDDEGGMALPNLGVTPPAPAAQQTSIPPTPPLSTPTPRSTESSSSLPGATDTATPDPAKVRPTVTPSAVPSPPAPVPKQSVNVAPIAPSLRTTASTPPPISPTSVGSVRNPVPSPTLTAGPAASPRTTVAPQSTRTQEADSPGAAKDTPGRPNGTLPKPPPAEGVAARPSASPARTSPAPPETLPPKFSVERVTQFLHDYLHVSEGKYVTPQLRFFEFPVDYFDHGKVNYQFVRTDTLRYMRRWPRRRYTLTEPVKVTPVIDQMATIDFSIAFSAQGGKRRSSGHTNIRATLQDIEGKLKIVGIKEERLPE